ncbi:UNVERIFIED_CONTAM: hypothetical protein RMT77_013053 [Armadillidium vulgare]
MSAEDKDEGSKANKSNEEEEGEKNKEETEEKEENGAKGGKGDKKGAKKKNKRRTFKESGGKKGRVHIDVLGETAMDNALYICHSVQELLFWRGYQWAPGGKKPKKGKK